MDKNFENILYLQILLVRFFFFFLDIASSLTVNLTCVSVNNYDVPNINISSPHISALVILNTETNVINSVRLSFFFSFSLFFSFFFCVCTLWGARAPSCRGPLRLLHLPGSAFAAHEHRSRAGDFKGFACFTKLLLECGI